MTTPRRPHRALLVLTAAPADDAHGNEPWSVFTTEGWTVDITCIAGRSGQTRGQPDLDGAHHDSADPDWADPDWADRDRADRDCADYDIVCFVDGHTTRWASPRSADLSRLLSRISEYGKVIAAVRPAAFNSLQEFSLRDR
jgi:putative intracellular protease/amidase